jgi:hypothetical protein
MSKSKEDILSELPNKFDARLKFKGAVNAVKAINRMKSFAPVHTKSAETAVKNLRINTNIAPKGGGRSSFYKDKSNSNTPRHETPRSNRSNRNSFSKDKSNSHTPRSSRSSFSKDINNTPRSTRSSFSKDKSNDHTPKSNRNSFAKASLNSESNTPRSRRSSFASLQDIEDLSSLSADQAILNELILLNNSIDTIVLPNNSVSELEKSLKFLRRAQRRQYRGRSVISIRKFPFFQGVAGQNDKGPTILTGNLYRIFIYYFSILSCFSLNLNIYFN